MEIELWPVEKPKDYSVNAKIHSDDQIRALTESIKKFGLNRPIGVDENGVILYGHGTRQAVRELGYDHIPVIVIKDLSASQKRAYRLADNKINMMTGFDLGKLSEEVDYLLCNDIELTDLGFTDQELLAAMEVNEEIAPTKPVTVQPHTREVKKEPSKIKRRVFGLGDEWQLGEQFTVLIGSKPEEPIELPPWAAEVIIKAFEDKFHQKAKSL